MIPYFKDAVNMFLILLRLTNIDLSAIIIR